MNQELQELRDAARRGGPLDKASPMELLLAGLLPDAGDPVEQLLDGCAVELAALADLATQAGLPMGPALAQIERRIRVAGEIRRREILDQKHQEKPLRAVG